jgi:rhodanese-related sulfurtransferase
MSSEGYAGDVDPKASWALLKRDPTAQLIDVRTPPEWSYVGLPDLVGIGKEPLRIAWQLYPGMEVNAAFVDDLRARGLTLDQPLLFLCRSGVRSVAAAKAAAAAGFAQAFNILGGFEGPHDPSRHRGTVAGWKVVGLPWIQG